MRVVLLCFNCVHSSFSNILMRKRKLVGLLLLYYRCIVTLNVMWLFLAVPRVGLQYVIVVFPDFTHLLFDPFSTVCDIVTKILLFKYWR